jgi:hypothetical protein
MFDAIIVRTHLLLEDDGHVRVTLETDSLEPLEESIEPEVVLDIVREDVLVGGASAGAMHTEQTRVILKQTSHRELIEEIDSSFASVFVRPCEIKSISGPKRSFARKLIEIHRLSATGEIMITKKHERAFFLNHVKARQWIGTVSDDVTETDDLIDRTGFDFRHHRAECDGIRMNVTDDRDTH